MVYHFNKPRVLFPKAETNLFYFILSVRNALHKRGRKEQAQEFLMQTADVKTMEGLVQVARKYVRVVYLPENEEVTRDVANIQDTTGNPLP